MSLKRKFLNIVLTIYIQNIEPSKEIQIDIMGNMHNIERFLNKLLD